MSLKQKEKDQIINIINKYEKVLDELEKTLEEVNEIDSKKYWEKSGKMHGTIKRILRQNGRLDY